MFKMAKVENCSLEKLGKYELPMEPVHVELCLQDLIKHAQVKKFVLHNIKSGRALSDSALRKVNRETC